MEVTVAEGEVRGDAQRGFVIKRYSRKRGVERLVDYLHRAEGWPLLSKECGWSGRHQSP